MGLLCSGGRRAMREPVRAAGVRMNWRKATSLLAILWSCVAGLYAFQHPFHQFPGVEYRNFEVPEDSQAPFEFAFARLMFPPGPLDGYSRTGRFTGDWHRGLSLWTQDYPRSDRHFALALRRLTRVQVRSVEQPVNPFDGDDVFNWPFLYCAGPDQWNFNDEQYARVREYLARGGFILGDDFWGHSDSYYFQRNMEHLFPGRPIVEIENSDAIFHTVFDLTERYQVSGAWSIGGV